MYQGGYRITIGPRLPRMVRYLVIVNAAVYFWNLLVGIAGANDLIQIFGLTPALVIGRLYLWQPFTYLFLHGDFLHILFNMFALWMFGSELERHWGGRFFLKYYFVTGVGAGLFSVAADPGAMIPTIGASGAVYGILLAYGLLFPERYVFLYFLFPVKVKYFVAVLGVLAFVSALGAPGSTIAHIAHLGGMVVGFVYLKGWFSWGRIRQAWFRWRLQRMRARFKVHYGNRPAAPPRQTPPRSQETRRDDDYWIN